MLCCPHQSLDLSVRLRPKCHDVCERPGRRRIHGLLRHARGGSSRFQPSRRMAVSRHLSRSITPKARSNSEKPKKGGKVASYGRLSLPGVGLEKSFRTRTRWTDLYISASNQVFVQTLQRNSVSNIIRAVGDFK